MLILLTVNSRLLQMLESLYLKDGGENIFYNLLCSFGVDFTGFGGGNYS